MLKRILIRALNKVLGSYIENIDKHQLELGIFKGCISISNLKFRPSIVSKVFGGRVLSNHIGSLQVLIPWRSFNRKPIEIHIKDVSVCVGRDSFCWCFSEGSVCGDCVERRQTEFMNKMDRLGLMMDALREGGNGVFLEEFLLGGSFRLFVENVLVEHVNGASMLLKIREISFNREPEETAGKRVFRITGAELVGSSGILGPLDVCAKIRAPSEGESPYRISVQLGEFYSRMEQPAMEEIARRIEEHKLDRARWKLFRHHAEYRDLLWYLKEKNALEECAGGFDGLREDALEIWRQMISVQKKIMQPDCVVVDHVLEVMKRASRYRTILKKPSLDAREKKEKEEIEKDFPLARLLSLRKSVSSALKKRSWRDLVFFQNLQSPKPRRRVISSKISLKRLEVDLVDADGRKSRMRIDGGKFRIRELAFPLKTAFNFDCISVFLTNDEGCDCLDPVLLVSDMRGVLLQDSSAVEIKGCVEKSRVGGIREKDLEYPRTLARMVSDACFPCFIQRSVGNKRRVEFKVNDLVVSPGLGLGGSGPIRIAAKEAVGTYFNNSADNKTVASLNTPSIAIHGDSSALSNSIELSVLLINDVLYAKTSRVELYAEELFMGSGEQNGVYSRLRFPKFEVYSDSVKICRQEGAVEARESKAYGRGESAFVVETCRAKYIDHLGHTVFSVPRIKVAVEFGDGVHLDILSCRIRVDMERFMQIARRMLVDRDAESIHGAVVSVGDMQVMIRSRDSILRVTVSGYSGGSMEGIRIRSFSNSVKIDQIVFGEKYECRAVRMTVGDGDLGPIIDFVDKVSKVVPRGSGISSDASVSLLMLRSRRGLKLESSCVNVRLGEDGICLLEPFRVKMYDRVQEDEQILVEVLGMSGMKGKINIEGRVEGTMNEKIALGTMDLLEKSARLVPTSSEGSSECDALFIVSISLHAMGQLFRFDTGLVGRWRGLKFRLELTESVLASDDGECVRLSDALLMSSCDELLIAIGTASVSLGMSRLVSLGCSLLGNGSSSRFGASLACVRLVVSIGNASIKSSAHDDIRIRDLVYDGGLNLYCSVEGCREGKVVYEAFRTRRVVNFIVSVLGGSYELTTLKSIFDLYHSEYLEICSMLRVEKPSQALNILLVNVEGVVRRVSGIFRVDIPIGHIGIEGPSRLHARIACCLSMYNWKVMAFEPVVEENAVVVKRSGALLNLKMAHHLRILCSHSLVAGIRAFLEPSPTSLLHQKLVLRNLTGTPLHIKSSLGSRRVDGRATGELLVQHDECRITAEMDSLVFSVDISGGARICIRAMNRDFLAILSAERGFRQATVLHPLTLLSLCNLGLKAKIHRSRVVAMDLALAYNTPCTLALRHAFFLEIGLDNQYVAVGKIEIDRLTASECRDGDRSWMCRLKPAGVLIGIDLLILHSGSAYAFVLVFYPTLEVVNRMDSVLRLMVHAGEDVAEKDGCGFVSQNVVFSAEPGCSMDLYDSGDPKDASLGLCNLENGSRARILHGKRHLTVCAGLSGNITREACEMHGFFGSHVLSYKTRILISPPAVVSNNLGEDVWINGVRFSGGLTCTNRIDSINRLSLKSHSTAESISCRERGGRIVGLVSRKRGSRKEGGQPWSPELIFGGAGPNFGASPDVIRLLLQLGDDSGTDTIRIEHASLIRNETERRLMVVAERIPAYVDPGTTLPMDVCRGGFHIFLADCMDAGNLRRSGAFVPSEFAAVKYFSMHDSEARVFSVERISCRLQQTFCVRAEEHWPYMIFNDTEMDLEFSQESEGVRHVVRRNTHVGYALDSLLLKPAISLALEGKKVLLLLNRDGMVHVFGCVVSISQMERTRVVRISKEPHGAAEQQQYLSLSVERCSVSFIDADNAEVLCAVLRGVEVNVEHKLVDSSIMGQSEDAGDKDGGRGVFGFGPESLYSLWNRNFSRLSWFEKKRNSRVQKHASATEHKYTEWIVSVSVESVQIDNQDILCAFPVVLHPLDRSQRMGSRVHGGKFVVMDFGLGVSTHHVSVSNLYCRIDDFVLNVEECLVRRICRMFGLDGERGAGTGSRRNLRIQNLRLEKMRARINILKDLESSFISNVVGFLMNNISDFSLEVDGLRETDLYTTTEESLALFAGFYLSQLKKNFYKVFTHLDFMGNIGSLTESMSAGVRDLFAEPASAGTRSVAHGVIRGGKSLLRNTIYGVSNTIGKVSKSISTSASLATLDKGFRSSVAHHPYSNDALLLVPRKGHSKSTMQTLAKSTGDLFDSIASGVAGMAISPIEGASHGVSGFIKGFGRGMLGALAKPIVGVADLVTNVSDSIKLSMDGKSTLRIQYPRPAGESLVAYNDGLCQAFYVFSAFIRRHPGEAFIDGSFGRHGGRCQLILTSRRLLISDSKAILEMLVENVRVEGCMLRIDSHTVDVERPSFVASLASMLGR